MGILSVAFSVAPILTGETIHLTDNAQDYGVWRISYTTVPCESEWAGASNPAALGSVPDPSLQGGVCCPVDPIVCLAAQPTATLTDCPSA
jgi:hypothetical protein